MSFSLHDGLELLLLTAGYWLLDLAIHRDGYVHALSRCGVTKRQLSILLLILPVAGLSIFWRWESVPQWEAVRTLGFLISAFLCWKAITKDIDPTVNDDQIIERWQLLTCVIASWFSPAFLLMTTFLLTTPFRLWEHHSTLPMRVLQAVTAGVFLTSGFALSGLELFQDTSIVWFFILTIQISHYIITSLAKMWLGPKWYSWVTDNKLHHLAASAYSWGWAKFLPWSTWKRVISVVKILEKPMQLFAFVVEMIAPLALLHPYAGIGFCVGWSAFHLGVFSLSGLLFWDWILTNLCVAVALFVLPNEITSQVFGPVSVLAGLIFMVIFPLRHKLWKPMPLGWWDTPFTQRIHWEAHGESGMVYGVYNNFMCPHERLYGKIHACFLAPVAGFTYHLGEVWKHDLRDAIRDAGPDVERLNLVREKYGVEPRCEEMATNHINFLKRYFHCINTGKRKHVLPKWLRWLKAPGDQVFYWGDLPAFHRQEKVEKISLHYREEYFDGENLQRLHDEMILEVDIDESAVGIECAPEPTPKQIDDLLLSLANGKIIDLPDFGGGYIHGDDGKL